MDKDAMRIRVRLYVKRVLVAEEWARGIEHAEEIGARHGAIVLDADERNDSWLMEFYDPAMPEDRAYLRMGSDAFGMRDPRPVTDPTTPDVVQGWIRG